jgi:hypothetical protein
VDNTIIAIKGMSLKGLQVHDRDGKKVYPGWLNCGEMQEHIHMQWGSIRKAGNDRYAPFVITKRN